MPAAGGSTVDRNLATVGAVYEAFGRGDVATILEQLTPDVSWDADFGDYGLSWLRPRRGPAEVGEFFAAVVEGLEIQRFDIRSMLAGEDVVVAVIDIELTVKATGKPVVDREVHIWTLDADGKITDFRHVLDTHQHVRANSSA